MKAGAFRNSEVVRRAKSFECAFLPMAENWKLAQGYSKKPLAVVMLSPDGQVLGRLEPKELFTKGDPGELLESMLGALVKMREVKPRTLPFPIEGRELVGRSLGPGDFEVPGEPEAKREPRDILVFHFVDEQNDFSDYAVAALRKLEATVKGKGVRVVAVRAKTRRSEPVERIDRGTASPVVWDPGGRTLKRIWQPKHRPTRNPTLVVDRKGNIRTLHPGRGAMIRRATVTAAENLRKEIRKAIDLLLREERGKPAGKR